eukprot:UN01844
MQIPIANLIGCDQNRGYPLNGETEGRLCLYCSRII